MTDDRVALDEGEIQAARRAWQADHEQRLSQLRRDAQATWCAMEGWQRVEREEDWLRLCEAARDGHRSGRFLLERLGAERYLEPELMAVLGQLRRDLVGADGGSASEAMAADLAVMSYHNSLRLQRWIGDLALAIEHEFFGAEAPSARVAGRSGKGSGLVVEEHLKRLGEQLLPLQERASRMMLRNLQALADLRRAPAPTVAIGSAQQVNVGAQQVNVATNAIHHEDAPAVVDATARSRPSDEECVGSPIVGR